MADFRWLGILYFTAVSESTCLWHITIQLENDCDSPHAKIFVAAAPPKELKQIQLENLSLTLMPFKISFNFIADFKWLRVLDFTVVSESTCLRQKTIHLDDDCNSPNLSCCHTTEGPKTNTAWKPVAYTYAF